jgi:hypothetical protein
VTFSANSRYVNLPALQFELPDGRVVGYVARRFCPRPESLATLTQHTVTEGERLDTITARYLGDAEQFWRLCDANRALRPEELLREGSVLRITLPAGVAGATLVR